MRVFHILRIIPRWFGLFAAGGLATAQSITLDPPQLRENGVQLQLRGPVNTVHRVDAADRLPFWSPVELLTSTAATKSFLDPETNAAARFYRAIEVERELQVLRVTPLSGEPGDEIILEGQFFVGGQPGENSVALGGVDAVVTAASSTRLTVRVPVDARSGAVTVRTATGAAVAPERFTVLARVPVRVEPPGVIPVSEYVVVNTFGGAQGGLRLRSDTPLISMAVPTNQPTGTLLAVSVVPPPVLVFNASSTAEAMVFMHPLFQTAEPVTAARALEIIRARPEVAALGRLMGSHFAAGKNPVDQPDFAAAYSNALFSVAGTASMRQLAAEFLPAPGPVRQPQRSAVRETADFPVDAEWIEVSAFNPASTNGFIDELFALATGKVEGKPLGPRQRLVRRRQGTTYPYFTTVDWIVRVDEVDVVEAFPGGRPAFNRAWASQPGQPPLDSRRMFPVRVNPADAAPGEEPFPRYAAVGAKSFNEVTVPVKTLAAYVLVKAHGLVPEGAPDWLRPANDTMTFPDRDALYLVRSVGPSFKSGPEFDLAIREYPEEVVRAHVLNLVAGTMDSLSVLIDVKGVLGTEVAHELIKKVVLEAAKKVPGLRKLEDLGSAFIDLVKFTGGELADGLKDKGIEHVVGEALKLGTKVVADNYQKAAAPVLKSLDIGGGIGQILLRIRGASLISPLETTFVAIGDPFKLEVVSVDPPSGQSGDVVVIRIKGPPGLDPFGTGGSMDEVQFKGPDYFVGEFKSVGGPDADGFQNITVRIPVGLPLFPDGTYEVSVGTGGRVGRGSFRLANQPIVSAVIPAAAFAAADNFNGSAYGGDQVRLTGVSFNSKDKFFVPTAAGEVQATGVVNNQSDGDVSFNVPKGAITGPIRVEHKRSDGAIQVTNSPVLTVLGPPVIESITPAGGPIGTTVTLILRNAGTSAFTVAGSFGGRPFQNYRFAAPAIQSTVPSATTTNLVVVETPAGRATATFTVTPGLANGARIQVGGASPISLSLAESLASGTTKPADIAGFDDNDQQDPPNEPGDFVTDRGVNGIPTRYPVGADFSDTIDLLEPISGEAEVTINRDGITGRVTGRLVVNGSFNSISLVVDGIVIIRGNNNNFNRPNIRGTLIIEGDNNVLTTPIASDGPGPGLVLRGNGNRITQGRFSNRGGDGLRVEGGKFNQLEVTICSSNLGNGIVLTGGAEANTLKFLTGERAVGGDGRLTDFIAPGSGNAGHGLLLLGDARNNQISHFAGGSSGNLGDGIRLDGTNVTGNSFFGHLCSVNGGNGITLTNGAANNSFGTQFATGRSFSNALSGFAIYGSSGTKLSSINTANGEYGLLVSGVDDRAAGRPMLVASGLFDTDGTNGRAGLRLEGGTQGVQVDTSIGDLRRNRVGVEVVGAETRFNSVNVVVRDSVHQGVVVVDAANNDFTFGVSEAGGNGVEFRGAHNNSVKLFDVRECGAVAVLLSGAIENHFFSARAEPFASFVTGTDSGFVLAEGSQRNVIERLTVASTAGAGIVLRDPGTSGNQVIRCTVNGSATDGVQLLAGASGNRLGDERPVAAGPFRLAIQNNKLAGVRVSGAGTDDNEIQFCNFARQANQGTAIVIEKLAAGTLVRSNQFLSNPNGGSGLIDYAVIVRDGARGARITQHRFSQIGSCAVLVSNATDVIVGGPTVADQNSFDTQGVGVELTGADTQGCRLLNNLFQQHTTNAVLLSARAHDNVVGPGNSFDLDATGLALRAARANRITGNTFTRAKVAAVELHADSTDNQVFANSITQNPVGILATGASVFGNSFLDNAITANAGKGIELVAGANGGIRPPEFTEFLGDALYGTAEAPDGSTVQVFRDPADEGALKVAEAVVANGKFRAALTLNPLEVGRQFRLNGTVTDPVGNTSEFSGEFESDLPLTRLVWTSTRDGNPEIYLQDQANPAAVRLTTSGAADTQPRLSKEGTDLLFVSDRNGDREIYRQKALAGASPIRLTFLPGADYDPAWAPEGGKIVFTSERAGAPSIFVMEGGGAGAVRVLPPEVSGSSPAWSPNGEWIAFVQMVEGRSQLALVKPDGTGLRRLAPSTANDTQPVWSPDGTKLAFVSDRDGSREIYTVTAEGVRPTRVTDDPHVDRDPAWLPDGRQLVFASDRSGRFELYETPASGGSARRVTVSAGDNTQPHAAAQ